MKKILIILAALILLTAASVEALKWLELGPFEVTEISEVEDEIKQKPRVPTMVVDMETIQFPLVQHGSVGVTAQVQIKLETEGLDNAGLLKRVMPKIQDAFFLDLYGFLPRLLKEKGHINGPILKQRLQIIGERLTGNRIIKSVLVQSQIDKPVK